jgi:hypothetical protein
MSPVVVTMTKEHRCINNSKINICACSILVSVMLIKLAGTKKFLTFFQRISKESNLIGS